jgi:1-phosphatidylinositol-4-phosphate 5-kinase
MEKFSPGAGKSPSFFFFTSNKCFAVKTLKDAELRLLVKKGFLMKYCEHLKKNPNSLLCRFYGVYKIKIKFMKPISIIIMDNIMGPNPEEVLRIYDLKGSTF